MFAPIPALGSTLEATTLAAEAVTAVAALNIAGKAYSATSIAIEKTYQAGKITRRIHDQIAPPIRKGLVWCRDNIDWQESKETLIAFLTLVGYSSFVLGKEFIKLWRIAEQSLVYRSPEKEVSPQPVQKLLPPAKEIVISEPVQKVMPQPTKKVKQPAMKKVFTVKELKVLAKKAGHKNYSKLNKQALMNLVGV